MNAMEWEHLLSTARQSDQAAGATSSAAAERSAFNRDYGRVLYSSAFRRLQDKTQVFPLGRNDYVRTRMTHSLEVANVGRALAKRLHSVIRLHESADTLPEVEDMENIVATVCLAHDIGNPPFGHSGEDAITAALQDTEFAGFAFEGNAQGFRLLAKICDPIKGQGLDLTAASLAAFTKYPCTEATKGEHFKKFGIMPEEMPIFKRVAESCGLTPLGENVWARHPLALLMEAADDISYLIADIEDAYFSKIISYDECISQLASMAPNFDRNRPAATPQEQASRVHLARALAVGECIDRAAEVLGEHYGHIMAGSFSGSLMKHTGTAEQYAAVKQFSVERIYNHESVIRIEIAGFSVLKHLLQLFLLWVEEPGSAQGRKIGDILHAPPAADKHTRFLHVIDYVSGMTDSYALHTYNTLLGRAAY